MSQFDLFEKPDIRLRVPVVRAAERLICPPRVGLSLGSAHGPATVREGIAQGSAPVGPLPSDKFPVRPYEEIFADRGDVWRDLLAKLPAATPIMLACTAYWTRNTFEVVSARAFGVATFMRDGRILSYDWDHDDYRRIYATVFEAALMIEQGHAFRLRQAGFTAAWLEVASEPDPAAAAAIATLVESRRQLLANAG